MPESQKNTTKPFLKWAGGKYKIIDRIKECIPQGKVLVEPFVGAGAVFLNSQHGQYIINDINEDLINLYIQIQDDCDSFINYAETFFIHENNLDDAYYELRNRFNSSRDPKERSAIFLYLNKFGYNGLCRYNKSGIFNVPFGKHKTPGFPDKAIKLVAEKLKNTKIYCEDFESTFNRADESHVIYCDPPYAPLTETAKFSGYSINGFKLDDHKRLAKAAKKASAKGVVVVISNHDTDFVRSIYKDAKITSFDANRNISCKPNNRNKAKELIAIFES